MDPELWQELEELFNATFALNAERRAAFIEESCRDKPHVRHDLEELLAHHDRAGDFIEAPAYVVEAEAIAEETPDLLLGRSFGRYRILRWLGRGGMGRVYLAFDGSLTRDVAVKFLHEELTSDPDKLSRFRQEAQAASALNHPNILTIFDFGEEDKRQFAVTEYVEGETLRQRMHRPISLKEALDLCGQIASGLAAAHAAGIVHRDIKPENIMVRPDGLIKILDFGLAKLIDKSIRDPEGPTQIHTKTGMIMGTPQYMSPEQVRGRDVDARSDIWALGVILYEMLAGKAPFSADNPGDMTALILGAKPEFGWQTSELPGVLEWILKKALAKDRDERYQSVKELHIDLKQLGREEEERVIHSALHTLELDTDHLLTERKDPVARRTGSGDRQKQTVPTKRTSGRRRASKTISSIAIIPFVNDSADREAEYLSDGITESIINKLSQMPRLRVMARSTVFRYKGGDIDPQAIGRQLRVHAVLTGRIQIKDSLVMGTELVRVADGSQLWGQHFNCQAGDIFTVQEEIVRRISEKLKMGSSQADKKRLTQRHTQDAQAYKLYLNGRYFWNKRTPEGFQRATRWFDQAARKDPNYALAHAGLADCSTLLNFYGVVEPRVTMAHAKSAVQKAMKADEALAEVHSSAAMVAFWYDWDWLRAEIEFKRAIKLNPAYAQAHEFYGWYLAATGQAERSIEEGLRAIDLDRLEPAVNLALGKSCYFLRRFDDAIDLCQRALRIDPDFVPARFFLGQAYVQKGKFAEAFNEYDRGRRNLGESAFGTAVIAHGRALAGDRKAATKTLKELQAPSGENYIASYGPAMIHAALGNVEDALTWLERAYDERSLWMVYLNVDPVFDSLRHKSRFKALIRRLKFPSNANPVELDRPKSMISNEHRRPTRSRPKQR